MDNLVGDFVTALLSLISTFLNDLFGWLGDLIGSWQFPF